MTRPRAASPVRAPQGDPAPQARRARLVWLAAVAAYAVAVLHRGSFGVAGLAAADRFAAEATVLASFVVVQLLVYAGLQVPAGVLLDRFGSRAMIAAGALLMATGQAVLAVTTDLPAAYLARVLIGAGDAATFVSVLRLVPAWFPAGRMPVITQLTGLLGQLGQLAAAVPLVVALDLAGWRSSFLGLAAVGVLAAALAWTAVRDVPPGAARPRTRGRLLGPLHEVVRAPGTWLGFWSHAVTHFSMTVFLLMWGFPFLVSAQGLAPAAASVLLAVAVVSAMAAGPVIGLLTARYPLRRSWMVLTIALATLAVWVAVLAQPGPSPRWLLVVLVVVLGVGGPGSVIGFDYARTSNPPEHLGTATGLVNVGGFLTSVVSMLAVGAVLDLAARAGLAPLSLPAFRLAFAVLLVPWLVTVVGVVVTRRRARLTLGRVVPPLRPVRRVRAAVSRLR